MGIDCAGLLLLILSTVTRSLGDDPNRHAYHIMYYPEA